MKQRSLEEVKALSVEEAVEIMRQAGIVGAGGGGFPTYFKYKNPQPHLIVNATESEPGYWGDKLVHKEYLEEFLQLFEAMKAIFDFEQISLGEIEDRLHGFEKLEELFEILFVHQLVSPIAGFALGGIDDEVRLGVLILEVCREPTAPRADDAGLAHDLHGLFDAQGLYFFKATLLHFGHDPLPPTVKSYAAN